MFSKIIGSDQFPQELARSNVQTPIIEGPSSTSSGHHEHQARMQSNGATKSAITDGDVNESLLSHSTVRASVSPIIEGCIRNGNSNRSWPRPISLANFSPGLPLRLPYTNPSSAFPSWMLGQPSPISPTASNANARPRRKHARKNSWYTVRHHHYHHHRRQSSTGGTLHMGHSITTAAATAGATTSTVITASHTIDHHKKPPQQIANSLKDISSSKKSSNKLLCLWPLPVVTRCVIALSLIVSAMNFFGSIHLSCSSPSFVIYRLELGNLFISPFFIPTSFPSFVLFGWNVLILGLFEESLAQMLGGTRQFAQIFLGIVFTVCTVRQGIGYLFSKSTGFAVPRLFFSDSLHECSQGLAPFLFALLVTESLSIKDKYILMIGPNVKITIRKFALQLVMLLVNYTVKNILWWSLTGLLVGCIATVIIQAWLSWHRQRAIDDEMNGDSSGGEEKGMAATDEKAEFVFVHRHGHQRTPLWRLLGSAIQNAGMVVMITLPLLLLFNAYYTRETHVDPATLNSVTHDRYMFTFIVMTAPRRGNPPYLSRTLDSYLANWPVDPEPGSLHDRTQAIVYTHFTNHTEFDLAKARFSNDLRGKRYLKWVRQDGNAFDQRLHVSKALNFVADNFQSTYIALVEDDFPLCGENAWRQTQNVIYAANQQVPGHCGVFVGTGGSGLFIKPKIARIASRLLLKYDTMPPDVILQQCIAGLLPECDECSQTLVTSKTLLMFHIGYNTSTSEDRTYKKHDFQCGWRHPFNGDPNVITL